MDFKTTYKPVFPLLSLLLLLGCTESIPHASRAGSAAPAGQGSAGGQSHFRVRSSFTAPLNSDQGWAGALDQNVTIHADRPFRLRFEIERATTFTAPEAFRLQYRRNGDAWTNIEAHDFPHPESEDAKTPRVSIVGCAAYANGAATSDVLRASNAAFQAGAGVSLADRTPAWSGGEAHTEFEWAVVVRRFADGAVTNDEGDTFEFRMVDTGSTLPAAGSNPLLRLAIPPGHVGGTFVETPGRIGPFRASNGDLYFIMEPAETSNLFMMIKSTDDGRTWREIDGANRPPTHDLESVDARMVGDTIHIVHQVTRSTRYHSFRTSDHRTQPDSWAARGEVVATATSVAQAASLVVRPDSSMAAFYVGQTKVHFSTRPPGGAWTPEVVIDPDIAPNLAGPQAVLGADGVVHLAYYGTDGTIWYRRLLPDGKLTPREQLASGAGTTRAEYGAVLPLLFNPRTNTLVIIYRLSDGRLWERRVVNNAAPTPAARVTDRHVVRNAVDSQQPGADAVLDGDTVHVFFIEESSRSIFSTHDRGGWQPSRPQVENILGSWIRGSIYPRKDGRKVYGFIYDAGSDGGAGMNRFGEVAL